MVNIAIKIKKNLSQRKSEFRRNASLTGRLNRSFRMGFSIFSDRSVKLTPVSEALPFAGSFLKFEETVCESPASPASGKKNNGHPDSVEMPVIYNISVRFCSLWGWRFIISLPLRTDARCLNHL